MSYVPTSCFGRVSWNQKKKFNVQRRTRLMTFENFKSDWIDLRALNEFLSFLRHKTKLFWQKTKNLLKIKTHHKNVVALDF